jgi:hypothetical protein
MRDRATFAGRAGSAMRSWQLDEVRQRRDRSARKILDVLVAGLVTEDEECGALPW